MSVKTKAHIFVATPCYTGGVVHECAQSMQVASIYCVLRGVVLEWVFASNFSLVQLGRNWLLAEFLSRTDCTHLLWLDDDLGFEADGIMKLYESNKDVVGGVYLTKSPRKSVFPYEAIGPAVNNLQPVRKLPGGFLLMKRHVVEKIASQCPLFRLEHDGVTRLTPHVFDLAFVPNPDNPAENLILGEDFVANRRAIEAGFEIWARTDISFAHLGRYAYNGRLQRTLDLEPTSTQVTNPREPAVAVPFL